MSESAWWGAVIARDRSYDGVFVLAVRTTGIYCRPSCAARTPRRENVCFYPTPQEAEAAGFRACKRCQPNAQAADAALVEQACRYIDAHAAERITLADLGAALYISPHHLQRTFRRVLGISPRQYQDARRREQLKAGLKAGAGVAEAIYGAGYGSSSRIYAGSPLGMTPATYQKGGEAMAIQYTIAPCSLGLALVGATERGVCAVSLGDDPAQLEAELRADYPTATITRAGEALAATVAALLEHIDGGGGHLDLPLDVRATAFQRRVWEALQAIPAGETRTYSEIAAAIGHPGAARAVGSACANNRVSILIPCHRAVRADGGLGGYRWGLARKEELLRREREGKTDRA